MFDMDKGSRGPDPYKLLTPRLLLLSLVLRLHCGAVVEKQATLGTADEVFNDETWAIRLANGLIVLEGPIVIIVPVVGDWTRLFATQLVPRIRKFWDAVARSSPAPALRYADTGRGSVTCQAAKQSALHRASP
jgi:hypothetical protein